MPKRARLEARITAELDAALDAHCRHLGESRTAFIERALEAALPSQARPKPGGTPAPAAASPRARRSKPPSLRDTWRR